MHPEVLLPLARDHDLVAVVSTMVGEFVVEGAPLVWVWAPSPDDPPPDPAPFREVLPVAVRLGYERTAEQDVAFGVRQLADIAVKALSPAINDPYTAIQALEHLGVLLAQLVRRPLGSQRLHDDAGTIESSCPAGTCPTTSTWPPGRSAGTGAPNPGWTGPCSRVLATTGTFCRDPDDRALIAGHVQLVVEDAERTIATTGRPGARPRSRCPRPSSAGGFAVTASPPDTTLDRSSERLVT